MPDTGCPAFTVAGNVTVLNRSADAVTVVVTLDVGVALLLTNPAGGASLPLSISNATDPVNNYLQYPGNSDTPGNRLIPLAPPSSGPVEDYVPVGYGAGGSAVAQIDFNFQSIIGTQPNGQPYYNTITPQQELDAEDIL